MGKTTKPTRPQGKQEKTKAKSTAESKGKSGRKTKTVEDQMEDAKAKCHSIRALFLTHTLVRLREIEHLFTKAMADQIGINHGRFIDKLKNPIKFSTKDIYKFSYYVDIEPEMMMRQIRKEVEANTELVDTLKKMKPLKEKKKPKK